MSDKLINKDSFAFVEGTKKTEHEELAASHEALEADHEALKTTVNGLLNSVGGPLIAETVADMTDTTKVYVYVGSESGYTAGNWYYYNGSAWVSGGVYNSFALETDETLSVSGMAADAAIVGSELQTIATLLGLSLKNVGVISNNGDLDDLLSNNLPYVFNPNSIWTLRSDYNYYNAPENAGYVLTLRKTTDNPENGIQIFFGETGNIYIRNKKNDVWDVSWLDGNETLLANKNILPSGNLNDVNDNSIYLLDTSIRSYESLPEGASGVLCLITTINKSSLPITFQVLFDSFGSRWTRRHANSWTQWYGGIDASLTKARFSADAKATGDAIAQTIKNSTITITNLNKSEYFTDANDAPNNSVYRIKASAEMNNTPYGDDYSRGGDVTYEGTVRSVSGYLDGILMTYGTSDTKKVQLFVSGSTETTPTATVLYYRASYTVSSTTNWSEWHILSDRAAPSASNIAIRKKLIAPYLDGEGNPTATDTGTPNPQFIDDPLYFNDFNDAPLNSIYQIDLDCDETVMANNPLSGRSSILMTWCWSYYRRHAVVQFCLGLPPATGVQCAFYYRYGYANSSTEFVWTNWESARATTDSTLTKEGRAADAKTVGDRLAALEARLAALENA